MATLEQVLVVVSRIEEKQQSALEVQSAAATDIALLKAEVMGGKDEKSLRVTVDALAGYEQVEHRIFKGIGAGIGALLLALIGFYVQRP